MGVGDGFGADVINTKGREAADTDACDGEPQADKMIVEMKNRMM